MMMIDSRDMVIRAGSVSLEGTLAMPAHPHFYTRSRCPGHAGAKRA